MRRRKAGVKIAWCDSRKPENIEIKNTFYQRKKILAPPKENRWRLHQATVLAVKYDKHGSDIIILRPFCSGGRVRHFSIAV
jgi:hypothetical protein